MSRSQALTPSTGADTGRHGASHSLRRQLVLRFALVFLLVTISGSLLALTGYQMLVRQAQQQRADEAASRLKASYATLRETWGRNAEEVKAQIDFMRLFGQGDQAQSWLRLRAYFAVLEGRLRRFPSGVVLDGAGSPVFDYGPDGPELRRRLQARQPVPRWTYMAPHHTVLAVMEVPLWLGRQGNGTLVLLQPMDGGVMQQLAPHDSSVYLVYNGQVLASTEGDLDLDRLMPADYHGPLAGVVRAAEQRSVQMFPGDPDAPRLIMRQSARQVLSPAQVLGASFALMTLLAGMLWLAMGRWTAWQARRIAWLSEAAREFSREQAIGPAVERALAQAGAIQDEVGEVAVASRELMQSVLRHHHEQFGYLQTLDLLEEGVVEIGPEGECRRASPGWLRLAGRPQSNFVDAIHQGDRANLQLQLGELFSGEKSSLSGRARLSRGEHKDLWIEYRFVAGEVRDGKVQDVRGVLRDVTQSYQLEKHVTHMALHDALTGLPNRVLLEDRCKMALRSAERSGMKVAMAFFDLDHFKHVNDQFGHKTGDELLVALSSSMRNCLRAGDTLARWGGDEFVVLLTDLHNQADAEDAVQKVAAVCQNPIRVGENQFNATFSMGVAMYPQDGDAVDTLLSQADRAMFAAKQRGRNAVCFYAEIAQREEDRKAIYIQNRLASAIREHRIQAWFQPIVDARTRQVVSCEALARWHDETYGWVSPATFVPMAENLGLIRELGQQIWKQAIESLHDWRSRGMDMRISVNVSRRQLFTPSFTTDLLHDLDRLAIPVSVVDLEITESVAMEDAEHTERRLAELTEAGFGIAIDDFGTGYSSLSQLHDMPASKIKIDTSFVHRAMNEEGGQLVQAIVKIAGAFRLQTVAEGVEDETVAVALTQLGVHLLQGYHFGRPMDAPSFERYLADNFVKA